MDIGRTTRSSNAPPKLECSSLCRAACRPAGLGRRERDTPFSAPHVPAHFVHVPYLQAMTAEDLGLDSLPPLLRVKDVARVLAVSERTVARLLADGRLGAMRDGRMVRIPRASLAVYVAERVCGGAEEMPGAAPRRTIAAGPSVSRTRNAGAKLFSFGPIEPVSN